MTMKTQLDLKKILPDAIAVIAFIIISFCYFMPAITEGRVLQQADIVGTVGAGEEAAEYYESHGERTRWTNGLFGGMPTYQIAPSYDSTDALKGVVKAYHLWLPEYVWLVFVMLIGFYIMLRVMGMKSWLSALGAIVWAFSSYFFIIIAAGHLWKFFVLAYIPPTIAGIILTYKGKYLAGGIMTAFFMAIQILSNHVQMTYYSMFIIAAMVIAYFIEAYKKHELNRFFKASAVVAAAVCIGALVNLSNLYHTYEYSKHTMRGGSELSTETDNNRTGHGLDRDYIVQWSYGIGETFSLLVPNVKGGASVPLAANETAMEKADSRFMPLYQGMSQYWGEQPFTSGPVYVGAFVVMLAILALFIVKGPMKWALLIVTLLSFMLSWGKNMMWFTNLFIDWFPMYAKFRSVSSILVIAEFTIPLLAMMGLKELFDHPDKMKQRMRYALYSFAIAGGIALLFWLMPGVFFGDYVSDTEYAALNGNNIKNALASIGATPDMVIANLNDMREAIFRNDAIRSFLVILIGSLFLFAGMAGKLKPIYAVIGMTAVCLADMWNVDKRYLNDSQFVQPKTNVNLFPETPADKYILQDKALDYRVLNMAVSTFNDNTTSYHHKSIGGYHAAKLQRYDDMISHYIVPEIGALQQHFMTAGLDLTSYDGRNTQVINMLNTKYIIVPIGEGKTLPVPNPHAMGNAWFVDNVIYVDNADREIAGIADFDMRHTAVADKKFESILGKDLAAKDSTDKIILTEYEPNRLVYKVSSKHGGLAVFSEIYYPEWTATIDGKPLEIGRVNYILRAANIPAGEHTVEMTFDPHSIHVTEAIAWTAIAIIAAGIVAAIAVTIARKRKKE